MIEPLRILFFGGTYWAWAAYQGKKGTRLHAVSGNEDPEAVETYCGDQLDRTFFVVPDPDDPRCGRCKTALRARGWSE